jgi:rubrerythrin
VVHDFCYVDSINERQGGTLIFTLTDIRTIAVQIEQNGEETYRRAALQTSDPKLAHMLNWLADEEKHHGKLFASIVIEKTRTPGEDELEAMGRSLLQDIVRSQTFSLDQERLKQTTCLEDLLSQSIEFETDTIEFYQFFVGFFDDQETIAQLNAIIEQEREHVRQLEQMRVRINRQTAHEANR